MTNHLHYFEKNKNQRQTKITNQIDELLEGLDLSSDEPHVTYNPDHDDLGEWFSGAPSWIRRS